MYYFKRNMIFQELLIFTFKYLKYKCLGLGLEYFLLQIVWFDN